MPEVGFWLVAERRRHDADDGIGPIVQRDWLSDRVGHAAENAEPQPVTDDRDRRCARYAFLRQESASQGRRDADHLEEVRRPGHAAEAFGGAVPDEAERRYGRDSESV